VQRPEDLVRTARRKAYRELESGALFRTFRVTSVPTVIAIDAHGRIERRIEGSDPRLPAQLHAVALGK
jgi:hypothetical protein